MNTELSQLSRTFIEVIPRTMTAIRTEMRGAVRKRFSGLTVVHFRVLAQLGSRARAGQSTATNGELAEVIGVSVPAMSRLVDSLVKKGSVTRTTSKLDRRQVDIGLTMLGKKQFAELSEQAIDQFSVKMEGLGAEQRKKLSEGLAVLEKLFLLAVFSIGSAQASAPLTLQDAVEQALAKNPQVLKAREKVIETESTVSLAYAQLFPTIGATLTAQHRKDALFSAAPLFAGTPYNLYQAGITANQPLLQGGALWGTVAVARQDLELVRLDREIAERDLSSRVMMAFYGILLQQERLDALSRNERISRDFLGEAKRRSKIGRGRHLDVLQAKTQLALLTPQIALSRNQMRISGTELATLVGSAGLKELNVVGELSPPSWENVQKRIGNAHSDRFENRRARRQTERFEDQAIVQMAKHWPTVSAFGTVGASAFKKTDLLDSDASAWQLGLQITVPLFSGLSSVRERSLLASQLQQLESERMRVADQITLERATAQQLLEVARETIVSSKQALDLAQESLKEAKREYSLGTVDYQQLLTSQQNSLGADISYAQARFDYLSALVKYFVAFGHDLDLLVGESGS